MDGSLAALDLLAFVAMDVGDEAILLLPAYFNYPVITQHRQGKVKYVEAHLNTLEPDVDAIRHAIGSRTRCIFLSSPNNPTGVVYGRPVLERLHRCFKRSTRQETAPYLSLAMRLIAVFCTATSSSPPLPASTLTLHRHTQQARRFSLQAKD